MTTILDQVRAEGFTSDSQRDWSVRKLAEWEDLVGAGQLGGIDADELAMVRHELMYPTGALATLPAGESVRQQGLVCGRCGCADLVVEDRKP